MSHVCRKISETEVSTPISAVVRVTVGQSLQYCNPYCDNQPAESPSISSTQDTEKVINELRSTLEQVIKERYYTCCTISFLIHDTEVLGKDWIYLFVTHSLHYPCRGSQSLEIGLECKTTSSFPILFTFAGIS